MSLSLSGDGDGDCSRYGIASPSTASASNILARALQDMPHLIDPSRPARPDFSLSRLARPGQDRSSSSLPSLGSKKAEYNNHRISTFGPPVPARLDSPGPGRGPQAPGQAGGLTDRVKDGESQAEPKGLQDLILTRWPHGARAR